MAASKFEQLRLKYLEESSEKGQNVISEGAKELNNNEKLDSIPNVLPAIFASETLSYSLEAADEMDATAENYMQRQSADIIHHEILNNARKSGLASMDVINDEVELSLDNIRGEVKIDNWETWLSDFYREFSRADYLEKGLSRHKMEDTSISELVSDLADTSHWIVEEDVAGELYLDDIYVVDEDWIDYNRGKKPAAYDQEVVSYLRELGVGN